MFLWILIQSAKTRSVQLSAGCQIGGDAALSSPAARRSVRGSSSSSSHTFTLS